MNRPDPRPWRILHVITRLERGGSSDCTLWQAIGAARRGHEVTVVSGPTGAPSPLLERARRTPHLRFVALEALVRPVRPASDLRALFTLRSLIRRERFDVIHLHTSKAGALGRLAALFAGASRRVVHQPHGHLFYGYYGGTGAALITAAERALAPLAKRVVTLTDAGAREHLERGVGRADQFRTLPSGIDFRGLRNAARRRDRIRRSLGLEPGMIVVGTLCRLEAIKGVEEILEAFLAVAPVRPRAHLVIAGDGPLRAVLQQRMADHPAGVRAHLSRAWVVPEEFLPALDLFVLASRNEGMGRALVEAMGIGVPVVATAVGGVPDLLDAGAAGALVPPGDATALAATLARLMDDPLARQALGRAGRARAGRYGAGRMVRRLLDIYKEVAA
ncbi:MAG TPA: glycosyltransferase [Dongiaceae bacterium]|nr:glycosyltransferase [Dongiaceae bacterium]